MSYRRELKALGYIQRGDVLRLKSYIRKHRHLRLDKPLPGGQSLLHAACALGDDACALLLLRKGADPLQSDKAGNNALHVAAREAEKKGRSVYTDLVVPILRRCPQAINVPNFQGTTPRDILRRAEDLMEADSIQALSSIRSSSDRSATEDAVWQQKLLAESMDEYQEVFGQYDDDFVDTPPEEETFESWADRISQEYRARRRKAEEPNTRKKPAPAANTAREDAEQKYLEQRQRMEAELRQVQKTRYQSRCEQVFGKVSTTGKNGTEQEDSSETGVNRKGEDSEDRAAASGTRLLGYSDIPWPLPHGTAEQMAQSIARGSDSSNSATYKRYLRAQQVTWHPDRFLQRCGGRLREGDRERVLRTVTALSQELNRLAELAK
ncbi:NF-kappa-B inhibitor-like protein 1 [Bombina bombina]|uniref:NF-kappa-B inhibitor-like protein 1 n=1 Tax=Bombina bombina TaxID=8345 RepID=UPI00235AB975|nr:NF-kappa-B inhibitor-like protein 1 [Bombina bombina]